MTSAIASLLATGTKLWLDSVDPNLVRENRAWGATGATSNPIIIADLIKSGRFDTQLDDLLVGRSLGDEETAWELTDYVVRDAQSVFLPVWEATRGDDGYVSFELDPLLEDPDCRLAHDERVARYIKLGKQWSTGQANRMIKVPATPAGLDAPGGSCDWSSMAILAAWTGATTARARTAGRRCFTGHLPARAGWQSSWPPR